jgi:DNA-binding PadR family transcriptional regulator
VTPVFRHGRLRLYLLKLLDESPRHGYEVIRLLQDRFLGVYSPSPGTIYPRLARLEAEGLVTRDEADGKKVYRITEKGRQELRNRIDDLSDLEDELSASARGIAMEIGRDVRDTVRSLREELGRTARSAGSQPPAPGHGQWGGVWAGASSWADPGRRAGPGQGTTGHSPGPGGPGQGTTGHSPGPGGPGQGTTGHGPGPRPSIPWADLERLAADFAREMLAVARAKSGLDESGLRDLRGILSDALTRIRSEVFGPGGQPGATGQSPGSQPGATGQSPGDRPPTT